MEELLSYINGILDTAGMPYEYLQWTQDVTYPYFIGEYSEAEPLNESGEENKQFIITGFCRGRDARLQLEKYRHKIEQVFPARDGRRAILESGSGVVIFYATSYPVPSGELELYKIQINLFIKMWRI